MHETDLRTARLQLMVLGLAVLVAASVVVTLLVRRQQQPAATTGAGPALVSRAQLEHLAQSLDHPVYWAGPLAGFSYELTATSDGRIYVRYLPKGVPAGDSRPNFLAVGTYARAGSFRDLKRAGRRNGAISTNLPKNGLMVESKQPQSVYIGYPGAKYQVEVFSPVGQTARRLVLSGTIVPIR